jgi:Rrf2 family protein
LGIIVLERRHKLRHGKISLWPAFYRLVRLWARRIWGEHSRIRDSGVKLSVKSDYAARAVLWLCQHYQEGVARTVEEMASAQGIPPNYLVQILIELKSAHIVKSQRGKDGGYLLARPPAEITFGDVLRCIHGEIFDSPGWATAKPARIAPGLGPVARNRQQGGRRDHLPAVARKHRREGEDVLYLARRVIGRALPPRWAESWCACPR